MPSFTLATYNIHYGFGQDGTYDLARIAADLAPADIVCLQEITQNVVGTDDQVHELADLLGHHAVFAPGVSLHVEGDRLARRCFGNAVLSRWPIVSTTTVTLPGPHPSETQDLGRSAIACIIEVDGHAVRVVTTHLSHRGPAQRLEQVASTMQFLQAEHERLALVGPNAVKLPVPSPSVLRPRLTVLAGDFNCEPDSAEYDALQAGYPGPGGTSVPLRDVHADIARPSTFRHLVTGRSAVFDYILVNRPDVHPQSWIDHEARGSDHQPLFSRIPLE